MCVCVIGFSFRIVVVLVVRVIIVDGSRCIFSFMWLVGFRLSVVCSVVIVVV